MNKAVNPHHTVNFLSRKSLAFIGKGAFSRLYVTVIGIHLSVKMNVGFVRRQNNPYLAILNYHSRMKL